MIRGLLDGVEKNTGGHLLHVQALIFQFTLKGFNLSLTVCQWCAFHQETKSASATTSPPSRNRTIPPAKTNLIEEHLYLSKKIAFPVLLMFPWGEPLLSHGQVHQSRSYFQPSGKGVGKCI